MKEIYFKASCMNITNLRNDHMKIGQDIREGWISIPNLHGWSPPSIRKHVRLRII